MFENRGNHDFERLLHDGISAAKSGQRRLAQSLLSQASMLDRLDARPYLWLSSTTDDLQEQRQYLEQAVAADPTNSSARRGLALLTGKIDQSRLIADGSDGGYSRSGSTTPAEVEEAQAESCLCPKCGGHMSFSIQSGQLTCEYCGTVQAIQVTYAADRAEQVLDFVMPTTRGHRWALAQHRLSCERCGALNLLQPGQKTTRCPYCGSNQLVTSQELAELVDPQVIAAFNLDAEGAHRRVKEWLGKGLFAPDDLIAAVRHLNMRPAYYSCWTFDGAIEVKWTCEVKEGNSRDACWVTRNGTETAFFDDTLVPGVRALTSQELASIEPYNLKDVLEFQPGYIAGWPVVIYDRSLSDASLLAREKVMKKMCGDLYHRIEVGREKRNLRTGGGNWSGMTFKHALLPLWIGTYRYQNQEYHLLVNGQTGKVGGAKPRDRVKIWMSVLIAGLLVILLSWLVSLLLTSPGMSF